MARRKTKSKRLQLLDKLKDLGESLPRLGQRHILVISEIVVLLIIGGSILAANLPKHNANDLAPGNSDGYSAISSSLSTNESNAAKKAAAAKAAAAAAAAKSSAAKSTSSSGSSSSSSGGGASGSNVLFFDPLNGADRILTNEFSYWSPSSNCPYKSSTWAMTSGTLLIKNGAGYSGIPTEESNSICESSTKTDSAVFRLNTKDTSFQNVTVSTDYEAIAHGGGGVANSSYDGIHLWVGYQNEYATYTVTIFRWDNRLVIKKKVPLATANCDDPSNDGCYYDLTDETLRPDLTTANVWHHVDTSYQMGSDGLPHIILTIDGSQVFNVADTDTHGPTYKNGAVGVRGDNTEFYFKNFKVTKN